MKVTLGAAILNSSRRPPCLLVAPSLSSSESSSPSLPGINLSRFSDGLSGSLGEKRQGPHFVKGSLCLEKSTNWFDPAEMCSGMWLKCQIIKFP